MPGTHTEVYVHLVWSTWDRIPLLHGQSERAAYACIRAECVALKAEVLALGGIEDHVHLLVKMPSTVSLAIFMNQIKGATSHLLTHRTDNIGFKWQGGYGAYSVSREHVPLVTRYIERQREHHSAGTLNPDLEAVDAF
jgi:REP element-mobilizing transposase RayT